MITPHWIPHFGSRGAPAERDVLRSASSIAGGAGYDHRMVEKQNGHTGLLLHFFDRRERFRFPPELSFSIASFNPSRWPVHNSWNGPTHRSYICRIGTAFSEFTRCRPASRVCTKPALRSTSTCFITPNRVRRGNASTSSVVVRGPSRNRSSIARRVGSESAFHTGSSLSALLTGAGTSLLARLLELLQHVVPPLGDALAVLRIDHANCAMAVRDFRTASGLLDFRFQVIQRRV